MATQPAFNFSQLSYYVTYNPDNKTVDLAGKVIGGLAEATLSFSGTNVSGTTLTYTNTLTKYVVVGTKSYAGYTDVSASSTIYVGYPDPSVGYTSSQLVSYTFPQLFDAGYTVTKLFAAGFTATDLFNAGYSASDLALYNQPYIEFTGPNKYYFNVSDYTNSPYTLVFGTTVDVSSTVYNGTVYGAGYVFLDLTFYTGPPLFMFTKENAGMGYVPPNPSAITYAVALTDGYFLSVSGEDTPTITFQAGQSYVFNQSDTTNANYQLLFSNVLGSRDYYITGYKIVGTLGQPGAYTQLSLPSNFSGTLYYFISAFTREYSYDVIVRPYYSKFKYALKDSSGGTTHYNQLDIALVAPYRYYFTVGDPTNTNYQLVFGTTPDVSSSIFTQKVTRGRIPGGNNAFVYLDLSGYTGAPLYYFDSRNIQMGSYSTPTAGVTNFIVTISNSDVYLGGSRYPLFQFSSAKGTCLFDQSNISNTNNQLYFSRDPYSIQNYYDVSLVGYGTPGQPRAYSLITIPVGFTGNLYYVNEKAVLPRNITYHVKRTFNAYNQPAFAFSLSYDGPYTNQLDLSFTKPYRYFFTYYFSMSDPSANFQPYPLRFGTSVDVSSSIYTATVYNKESTPGTYRSGVYLDLSGYTGDTLYAFSDLSANMGYSPPPASPDFTYNVTVSGGDYCLDGEVKKKINFDANKTYLFLQSDSTNVGYPMIFGKLPDDVTNIVRTGIKIVGTLGQPNAYTLVTTPADFKDSLFYFAATQPNDGPALVFDTSYALKVVTNLLGQKVYSVSISGGSYYNQPAITFNKPSKSYFNVSDSTNSPYKLVFGTSVDVSSSIYDGTVYSVSGGFVFLDLTDYSGQPLYLFTTQTPGMGYVPPVDSVNTYAVTVSDQYFLTLNGTEMPLIPFQQGNSYVFRQNDVTNTNYQLMFSSVNGSKNYYTTNYSIVGTLGQPGAYTQITLPSGFSGPLFYFMKSFTREYNYDVNVQPYYSTFKYALGVSAGSVHYKQTDISLVAPNRYYFTVADPTDASYQMVFGTTPDLTSSTVSVSSRVTRGRLPGSLNAFVYLDLSGYVGAQLYYFDTNTIQMGYYPPPTANTTFVVTVSNTDLYLGGSRYPLIQFNSAKGSCKFDQSNPTNTNNQLYFSRDPYSIQNYYDISLVGFGTAGQPSAYSLITIPVGFTGNLYYVNEKAVLSREYKFYVKLTYNTTFGNPAFSFCSTIDGIYYNQINLNLTANNRYYFEYFFNMNDPSANFQPYRLVFGTNVDGATLYSGTVYKESSPGTYRSAVYLDLSGYTGDQLYAYSDLSSNMGYSPPPLVPDFTYNVTVSNGEYFLNNTSRLAINFDLSKTYLFNQSDPTNVGYPMIFGKLPDDTANLIETGIKIVGSLGQPNAYTLVTTPSDFKDSLFYFNQNTANKGPPLVYDFNYTLKVEQNILGQKVYSVSTSGGTYYNQPELTFTSPNKYYFNVSDSTNSPYTLVFGTTVDVSSSIYTGTVYNQRQPGISGAFVFLDLTNYTGASLYMFSTQTAGMGYIPHTTTLSPSIFTVTIVDQYYLVLNGTESLPITFLPNRSYVFKQNDITNTDYQLVFSQLKGMLPYYSTNYSIVGTLGQPGAYTQIITPSNFTGSLYYFTKSLTREYSYSVITTPKYSETKWALRNDTIGSSTFYNQLNISLTSGNRYYFEVSDSTVTPFQLVFGTQTDVASTGLTIKRGRSPGSPYAFVYLDLSGYTGAQLYYFDSVNPKMGYYLPPVANITYHVTVSNNDYYIGGSRYPLIVFRTADGLCKFDQSDPTNTFKMLYFSRDPYSITNFYDTGVTGFGTPGQVGAFSSITIPNGFSGNLYYVDETAILLRDYTYYVKLTYDTTFGRPAFKFSSTIGGIYYNQINLNLTANKRYYFEYFFDMNDPSANFQPYRLVFGTEVDSSSNLYTGTVYKESVPGSYRSAVYLDLSGYTGNQLYAFNDLSENMGYSPPPLIPDYSYNVTVSGGIYHLNNIPRLAIDFNAGKKYLFIQSDPTNVGYPLVFGKLPDDPTNIISDNERVLSVGSLGHPDAYTLVTTSVGFQDPLFYFNLLATGAGSQLIFDTSYQIRVSQNILGENVYAVKQNGVFYAQADISFSAPNKYYVDIGDATLSGFNLVFGTTVDISSTIYNASLMKHSQEGTPGAFIFLDLTGYTGDSLYLFDKNTSKMGFVPPLSTENIYRVSMSPDQYYIYLDGIEAKNIVFENGKTYLFLQDGSSNVNYQLVFGETFGMTPLYTTNYTIVGQLGRPSAYTQVTIQNSTNIKYFLKSLMRDETYYVKIVENHVLKPVFAFSSSQNGPYYNQPDISFSGSKNYYFHIGDITNTANTLQFGSTLENNDPSLPIVRGRTPGQSNAFVYLNFSQVPSSDVIYYFGDVSSGMGYTPRVLPQTTLLTLPHADISSSISASSEGKSLPVKITITASNSSNGITSLYFTNNKIKVTETILPVGVQFEKDVPKPIEYGFLDVSASTLNVNGLNVGVNNNTIRIHSLKVETKSSISEWTTLLDISYQVGIFIDEFTNFDLPFTTVNLKSSAFRSDSVPSNLFLHDSTSSLASYFYQPANNLYNPGYIGTNATNGISGEWIQLYLPNLKTKVKSIEFISRENSLLEGFVGTLLGSDNGSDWSTIQSTISQKSTAINSITEYSYIRFVFVSAFDPARWKIKGEFAVPQSPIVVTVSNNDIYLNGILTTLFEYQTGQTYIFDQSAASNSGHTLYFSETPYKVEPSYKTGITAVGSPGQAGAYTQFVVSKLLSKPLYVITPAKEIARDFTYFVKVVNNSVGKPVFAFANERTGVYLMQPPLSFVQPYKYYFDLADSSTRFYPFKVGTSLDVSSSINSSHIYYNELTQGSKLAYALLDLSGYTGSPLVYFNDVIQNMGYKHRTATVDFSYNVTVVNGKYHLNGTATPQINFQGGKSYYFKLSDSTNTGYPLVIGKQPDSSVDVYGHGFETYGTAGQSSAYVFLTLANTFTNDLFYYTPNVLNTGNPILITQKYFIKTTTNSLGQDNFAVSIDSSAGPYYNQVTIQLTSPNRYYFDTSDTSNDRHKVLLGTQIDNMASINSTEVTYMNNYSAYVNLSSYTGTSLFYFGGLKTNILNVATGIYDENLSLVARMGNVSAPSGFNFRYTVTVVGGVFYIGGVPKPYINFNPGQTYLFDQSSPTNTGYQMIFGRVPDDYMNRLIDGVTIVGTAGRPDAYTLVVLPLDFKDALFYFHPTIPEVGDVMIMDTTYYVRVVQNVQGKHVYALSTSSTGPFYNQPNISFTSPSRYFFNISHSSNVGYSLAFGTTVDISSSIYRGTTFDEDSTFAYLDLFDYTGTPLFLFDASQNGMGYIPPPTTTKIYNVTMPSGRYHLYLNNVITPAIKFSSLQTYLFTQDSSSNLNLDYEIVFGFTKYKLPLYANGIVTVMGTLGRPGAYTSLVLPPEFIGSLKYFLRSRIATFTYYVKVSNNVLGNPVYSIANEFESRRYLNQPIIEFTPGSYHFVVEDTTNTGYALTFGTTKDDIATKYESGGMARGQVLPGSTDSFIHFDLSGYTGEGLFYFDNVTTQMGYYPPAVLPSSEYTITVSISDEIQSYDKNVPEFVASQSYLFLPTDDSNDGFAPIVTGRTMYSNVFYRVGLTVVGTPGNAGAYTLLQLPSDFSGALYSYVLTNFQRDFKYYANVVPTPKRGDLVYGFSTTISGEYAINQGNLFKAPFRYYVNTEKFTNEDYILCVGSIVDDPRSAPTTVQVFKTFTYIDLSTYTGSPLYYFDTNVKNMGDFLSNMKEGLKNLTEQVLRAPVAEQRIFTKTLISDFLSRTDSTAPLVLPIEQMVGFVFKKVTSVLVVQPSTTFTRADMKESAIYALLENVNDQITLPTRNYEVTVNNIGNNQFDLIVGGSTFLTLSGGESTVFDYLNISVGSVLAELEQLVICFKRDTKILCFCQKTYKEKYMKIQDMVPGTLVKTLRHGYVALSSIGHRELYNSGDDSRIKNRLYECSAKDYPELFETLVITGCHSILKDTIGQELRKELESENDGKVYTTDEKYRVMAYLDKKTKPYPRKGNFEIWHFSLEHDDEYMNYGVYANGLLVETASKRMMKDYSDMTLKK